MNLNYENLGNSFLDHGASSKEWDMTIILLLLHVPLLITAKYGAKNKKLKFGLVSVYSLGMIVFLIIVIFNAEIYFFEND